MTIETKPALTFLGGLLVGVAFMYFYIGASAQIQAARINGTIEAITKLAPDCIKPFQQEPTPPAVK